MTMNQPSMYPTVPCPPMSSNEMVSGCVEVEVVWTDEEPTRPGDSILLVLQGCAS